MAGKFNKRFYRSDSLHDLFLDKGKEASETNQWLFEVSHEAANKGKVKVKLEQYLG